MDKLAAAIGGAALALFIAWVIFWPFFAIWAVNTLFALGIAYNFKTWLAMLIVSATFRSVSHTATKS